MNQKIASLSLIAILLFSSCGNSGGGNNPEDPGLDHSTPTNDLRGSRQHSPEKPTQKVPPKKLSVKELKSIYKVLQSTSDLLGGVEAYLEVLSNHPEDKMLRHRATIYFCVSLFVLYNEVNAHQKKAQEDYSVQELAMGFINQRFSKMKQKYGSGPQAKLVENLQTLINGITRKDEKALKLLGGPYNWSFLAGEIAKLNRDKKQEFDQKKNVFNPILNKYQTHGPGLGLDPNETPLPNPYKSLGGKQSAELKKIEDNPEKYRKLYIKIDRVPFKSNKKFELTEDDLGVLKEDMVINN